MDTVTIVKDILKDKVDVSSLKEDDPLTSLGLDSLDLVEVMLAIEDRLGVEFNSSEIANLSTLKDVIALINQKLAK